MRKSEVNRINLRVGKQFLMGAVSSRSLGMRASLQKRIGLLLCTTTDRDELCGGLEG
jgi:hypothetical protein